MSFTYDQPYNLGTANGSISIDVKDAAGTLLTNFTSNSQGLGVVTLTVSDTVKTDIFFIRNSDGVKVAVCVFDPRGWTDTSGVTTLLGYITAAPPTAATIATAVWGAGARTLTGFGTLATDAATAVWAAGSRTLTAFGFTVSTNANATETAIQAKTNLIPASPATEGNVTAVGNAVAALSIPTTAQIAAAIWAAGSRTLTAFGFTVDTNSNATETAIQAKTNLIPASPATEGNVTAVGNAVTGLSIPTTAQIAAAIWGAASRTLTAFGFTVDTNANATETAIQAKTDLLPESPAATDDLQITVNPTPVTVDGGFSDADRDSLAAAVAAADAARDAAQNIVLPDLDVSSFVAAVRGGGDLLFNPVVHDSNGAPVANASITILSGSTILVSSFTDGTGHVKFGPLTGFTLPAGSYTVLVRAPGFAPVAPVALNLAANAAPTYSLAAITYPVSENPAEVGVYFDSYALGMVLPLRSFKVRIVGNVTGEATLIDGKALSNYELTLTTNEAGFKAFSLLPSSKLTAAGLTGLYECEFFANGFRKTHKFTVAAGGGSILSSP